LSIKRRTLTLASLSAAAVLAGVATSTPAHAAETCYGPDLAYACAEAAPQNAPDVTVTDTQVTCVFLGGPACTPVVVPVPGVSSSGGSVLTLECYVLGDNYCVPILS
jgi:hypothetical protein